MCSERQDAFYVEFFEFDGMSVDLRERELLAQPVSLPLVRLQIAETAVQFIKGWAPPFDLIVPVPPFRKRLAYQPVVEIA